MTIASAARVGLMLGTLLGGAACAGTTGQAPRYSGRTAPSVPLDDVRDAALLPPGYEVLGTSSATCREDDGVVALDGATLGDVDCSDGFLAAALREKAAKVGGVLLVGLACRKESLPPGSSASAWLHRCSASIASGAPAAGAAPASSSLVSTPSTPSSVPDDADVTNAPAYASPDDAFRVRIKFSPRERSAPARPPRDPENVAELSGVPPGRVVMGDVISRCHDICGRDAVRYAVRAAAARVGATAVSDVTCVRTKSGWLCTGRATRPEVDEPATALR